MKKVSLLLVLLVSCFASSMAIDNTTTINRMVLKAVQEFDEIIVNGDVTVELRYNPEKEGYIVYHYDKNRNKDIRCLNDGNKLIINGNGDGLMSRIVVFYGKPLTQIVHNGNARLVTLRLKCDENNLKIISNGYGDVIMGHVKTDKATLVTNNRANISIRHLYTDNVEAVSNASGKVIIGKQH